MDPFLVMVIIGWITIALAIGILILLFAFSSMHRLLSKLWLLLDNYEIKKKP